MHLYFKLQISKTTKHTNGCDQKQPKEFNMRAVFLIVTGDGY